MSQQFRPLSLDVEISRRHLKLLGDGFVFQTFDERKANKRPHLAKVITQSPALPELQKLHAEGAGVYVTVNKTDGKGRRAENITGIRAVWCEQDGGQPRPFPIAPTFSTETSPGHFHRYWLVSGNWPANDLGRADFASVMERMVETYGSDKNAKDICRVLRLAGSLHRKDPHATHRISIAAVNGKRYSRTEILAAFPPIKRTENVLQWKPRSDDDERIRSALNAINADDREIWLQCGMALKAEMQEAGRPLWDSWSRSSPKYDERDQIRTWESFKGNGINIGTLFQHAKNTGWQCERTRGGQYIENNRVSNVVPPPAKTSLESHAASHFKMRGITWLWPGRFAVGKLALIAGLPDKGKGLISADMIARCTRGSEWPCGEGKALKGNVIWFTAEDGIEDTVQPRLVAAGADLDRVHIIGLVDPDGQPRMFSLTTDLPLLKQKIEEIGDVVLVVIDPVSAYLGVGKVNTASTTDVRGVLAPLTTLAEEKKISVLGIMHFNKKADVTNALLRVADSLAYVAAARHVYVVVDNSENDKARLFVKAKNNLGPDKNALRFAIGASHVGHDPELKVDIWAPYVEWGLEHVEVTAAEAMEAEVGGGARKQSREEAEEFLNSKLASGPAPATEVEEEAKANGISITGALRRARGKLGVRVWKEKGKTDGAWFWELPKRGQYSPD